MLYRCARAFAMVSAHALVSEWWERLRAHITMMTFTRFAQIAIREPACIVWLYYAYSCTVALSPGIIPSSAVLHTENLAFQCAT